MNLRNLRLIVTNYFSLEDLRTLCFDLDIRYDDLRGEGHSAKARELVLYLSHRGRLEELVVYIRRERPHLALDSILDHGDQLTPPPPDEQNVLKQQYQRFLKQIRRYLDRRQLIVFVGADLEDDLTGLPSRQQIADALADDEGLEVGQPLTAVAQQTMRHGNRRLFTDHISDMLRDAERHPQPLHKLLIGFVQQYQIETIVTNSYDDLLALAFRESMVEINHVVSDTNLQYASRANPTLIQLFGEWRQQPSLIVTEQDVSTLLNGRWPDKQEILTEMRQLFRRNAVLFIGYNLQDTAINLLFDNIAGSDNQLGSYAIWPDVPQPIAESWQTNRGLTVINSDPVLFLQTMLQP